MRPLAATALALACSPPQAPPQAPTPAADPDVLRPEWLAKDRANVERLQALLPPTGLDAEAFLEELDPSRVELDGPLGFGGRRLHVALSGGYASLWLKLVIDDTEEPGRLAELEVACTTARRWWDRVAAELRPAWRVPVQEGPWELVHRWRDDEACARIAAATARALGPGPDGEAPEPLREAYATLTEPLRFYDFGEVCYYGGVEPAGRVAIGRLVEAGAWELVRGALRGSNPEGRLYAAEAFLRRGELGAEDRDVIRRLRALDVPIRSCRGCFVTETTAAELIPDPGG